MPQTSTQLNNLSTNGDEDRSSTLREELVNLTGRLVTFKTINENRSAQNECLHFAAEYLSRVPNLHFSQYNHNGYPALVVTTEDTKIPDIMLNGHIDVVPADDELFHPRLTDNRIYGRGTLDMKGGVAALIKIFHDLALQPDRNNLPSLGLMLTSDEEKGGRDGVKYLVNEKGWRARFILTPEGRPDLTLVIKEKGVCWIKMTVKGASAHGAYPWLGKNALHILFESYKKIFNLFPPAKNDWQPTCNLATVSTGSTTVNQVPDNAEAMLDVRYTNDFALNVADVIAKFKQAAPEADFELIVNGPMLNVPEDHPAVRLLQKCASEHLGETVPLGFNHGASDAAHFADKNIPVMASGIVGGQHHAPGEYVEIQSIVDYYGYIKKFINRFSQEV